jgi:glycosyltransferase involved in cell wall biosynthesis
LATHPPILYIITKLELGGAQKVCLSLFKGITTKQHTTFLISGTQGPLVREVKESPHTILLDSMTREITIHGLLRELRAFWHLIGIIKNIKKNHPDLIVHTHSTKAGILGRWAAWCAGVKKRIHTIHGYALHQHQSLFIWLGIYVIELFTSFITTHFICVSTADRETGQRLFPYFARKSTLIRAAVDWSTFYHPDRQGTPHPHQQSTPFIFGTIACFKPQKNLLDLLTAFAYVYRHTPAARLEIIGDGIQRTIIEQWLQEHELRHVVTLHGWQEQVIPFMKQWHAFVLSSLWEGLPCSVVEARLLKLPVVSYHTGGIHEVITHGHNGLLCPQKEWLSLAKNMLSLSLDRKLYTQLQNYPDDLTAFSTATMLEKHSALYQRL